MIRQLETKNLEAHLQQLVRAQGSPSQVSVALISGSPSISASINLTNDEIQYEIPDDWNPEQYERIQQFADRLKVRDVRRKICDDVAFHEVGHRKLKNDIHGLGCPEDMQGKEITMDAVAEAMLAEGKFSQQGALYLENLISDVINNANGSDYTRFNGLSIFFAEQGEVNGGTHSPLYEAFVKLNMHLFGTKKQRQFLSQYYTNEGRIDEVVAACIGEVGLTATKEENTRLLFNKKNWREIYGTFAHHLVQLMDVSAPEYLPGSGYDGNGYQVPVQFEGEVKFDPEKIPDALLRKVLDRDNMKKVMQRRNKEGEDLPSFVENWRALDYFYLGEASELIIKAETPRKGERMPIAPIQTRVFDEEKDDPENILFGRVLLDEQRHPTFAVPRSYVEHTARYKKSISSYPELNIAVLDTSISMLEAANERGQGRTNIVPWGDNSKYHYALLAYYGVEKALHRMGVGTKTRYNLVTFSSSTEATGERAYEDRAEIKQRILSPTFGGTTNIDLGVLVRNAREPQSVLMTISDGEIWNWSDIKDTFKGLIADKFYVHFQIGADTETTTDLESWGATVVKIGDASEMPRRAIDVTQKFYENYAAGEIKNDS